MSYFFGHYYDEASVLPQGRPFRRIIEQKFSLKKKNLHSRTHYLINHRQHLNIGDICTRRQQLNTMLRLEKEAVTMQKVARHHHAYETALREKLRNIEELATDYYKSRRELYREKTKYERTKLDIQRMRRQCDEVEKENKIREILQSRLNKEAEVVKALKDEKRKIDVQAFGMTQLLEEDKHDHAQEQARMNRIQRKIQRKHARLDKADDVKGYLEQLNGCLRPYVEKLDGVAPVVKKTRRLELLEVKEDIEHTLGGRNAALRKYKLPF